MKKIVKNTILAVITFLAILIYTGNIYNGNSYNIIITSILFLLYYFYNKFDKKYDKKIRNYSLVLGGILSLCLSIGSILNCFIWDKPIKMFGFSNFFEIKNTMYSLVCFTGIYMLLYKIFCIMLDNLNKIKLFETNKKLNIKQYLIIFFTILTGNALIFVRFYPAIMSPDSYYVINYANNFILSDLHTFGHTWFFGAFFHLGKLLFNNLNMAVAFSVGIQVICMTFIFTALIKFLYERGLKKSICIMLTIFIALSPLHTRYSCTLWRDILFGATFILIGISLIRFIEDKEIDYKNVILFIISTLILMYFRNNGIYVFLFMIPFMIFILKDKRKFITILTTTLAVSYFVVKGPIFDYFGVQSTKTSESFSIPFQQLARAYVLNEEEIQDEKEFYNKFFEVDKIVKSYKPMISDPIKSISKNEYLKNNKGEFLKNYIRIFFKYPQEYIEAYLFQTLGYWYPDTIYWATIGESKGFFEENVYSDPLTPNIYNKILDMTISRNIPLCNLVWSVGLPFLLMIVSTGIIIYKKGFKYLLVFVPLYGLWGTIMIATPVFSELRYIYGLICCEPLIILLPFMMKNNIKKLKK